MINGEYLHRGGSHGDDTIFIDQERGISISRSRFFELSNLLSKTLEKNGFKEEDNLALVGSDWASTQLEYAVLMFSVWRLGGTLSIHPGYTDSNSSILKETLECCPKLIFAGDKSHENLSQSRLNVSLKKLPFYESNKSIFSSNKLFKINSKKECGNEHGKKTFCEKENKNKISTFTFDENKHKPNKLIGFSQKNMICGAEQYLRGGVISPNERLAVGQTPLTPPNFGFSIFLAAIKTGGTYIKIKQDARKYAQNIEKTGANKFFCYRLSAPSLAAGIKSKHKLSNLKKVILVNGEFLSKPSEVYKNTINKIENKTCAKVSILYGVQKSCSSITLARDVKKLSDAEYVGQSLPETEFKISENGTQENRKKGRVLIKGCQVADYIETRYPPKNAQTENTEWVATDKSGLSVDGDHLFILRDKAATRPLGGTKAPGVDNTY